MQLDENVETFLSQLISSITTYFIILVQFENSFQNKQPKG